jgi:6-phosphofructokinase 1
VSKANIFYAQSGGVTSVINASACGVIEAARQTRAVGRVLVGRNGILGALNEELIDTALESKRDIAMLRHTPSGAFGSCRYKLKSVDANRLEYERLIAVFKAHDIGYFFYNGGGDSQDTANKVAQFSQDVGYPVQCIGIPKTVDNDLPFTDTCPGFGSVAKYVAVATEEAGLDVASMAASSTKVFVLEVMGRHAGWIAAAAALAAKSKGDPPHIIILPEVAFDPARFLQRVAQPVAKKGYCVIVASEGAQFEDGRFLAASGGVDAFGHAQLGGVAPTLVEMIKAKLGYKCHWAVSDYLQRAARHIASAVDVAQAYAVGEAAVNLAVAGESGVMVTIERQAGIRYRWRVGKVALSRVANVERKMPKSFITRDGYGITAAGLNYLRPLIQGEDYPPYKDGLPQYVRLKNQLVPKKLPKFKMS